MRDLFPIAQEIILTAGLRLVVSIVLFIIGLKLIGILIRIMKNGTPFSHIDASVSSFIISFISILLKAVLLLTVAAILGIPMTNMVALVGSAGLAVGLSFQGSLSNFAGGLIILIFRPFNIGDYIESCSGAGTVNAISILYTTLLTADNRRVTIPNGSLSNTTITNYSAEEIRRVDMELLVAYDSDIDQVRQLIMDVVIRHELILDNPEAFVRFFKYGDSALVFLLRVWCKSSDYWSVHFDLSEQIKKEFDRHHIHIPYSQMDIHLVNPSTHNMESVQT